MISMGAKAVFIDRDGVISKEIPHPAIRDREGRVCTDPLSPEELVFFPGVKEAFARLKAAGYLTIIVSNQAGYAKGFLNDEQLQAVTRKVQDELQPDAIYYCLHHEDYTGSCECKKPKKGMLRQAVAAHGIDLSQSFMVGDRRNDMLFGDECRTCYYVDTRRDEDASENVRKLPLALQAKVSIVRSLEEAADLITNPPAGIFEAVIPCAGRGTRMGDMTAEIPKPMIAFDGVPFLQFIIYHLKQNGIRRFIIPIGYLGDVIREYFGNGSRFGVDIVYAQSSVEVETGGSFKRALPYVQGDAFIMHYGDSFWPYSFSHMTGTFLERNREAMIVCNHRPKLEGYDDKNNIIVDQEGNVTGYDKKNASGKATLHDVGVAYYKKGVAAYLEPDSFVLDAYLFPLLAGKGEIHAYYSDQKSIGMGNVEKVARFEAYLQTNDLLSQVKNFGA